MTSQTDLEKLEYTQNWLDFGILSEEFLVKQLAEFEQGEDKNTEHFRYATFSQFIRKHDRFSDLQVQNFIHLVEQDNDNLMAGSALKGFYQCGKLTPSQFESVEQALCNFGSWAEKVIEQNRIMIALDTLPLTADLIQQCIDFKEKYQSNILIQIIIEKTDDKAILERFITLAFGKTIRNLANQKLKRTRNPYQTTR